MTPLEDIKIFAYLSPNPTDDDSFLEEDWISWFPGYKTGETEEGLPSFYHEDNIALYEKIEGYSADLFKAALKRMWPLLEGTYFNQIHLVLDYTNFQFSDALAGYDAKRSNPGKGRYVFYLDQHLLNRYFHRLNGNEKAIPNMNIWEHELVHLIDHWEITRASSMANSSTPSNNLEYYLLKYREEGLANLFDLLDGKLEKFQSRAQAKEKFLANYQEIHAKIHSLKNTSDEDRKEIYQGLDFYEVGPWLILEMLDDIFFASEMESAASLEEKIAKGIIIPDEDKLEILKKAFLIDNEWFLSRLNLKNE